MSRKVIVYGSEQKTTTTKQNVVDFTPTRQVTKNLSELINQIIYIHDFEINEITIKGNSTKIIILSVSLDGKNPEKYHSFSSVLMSQLEPLKSQLDGNTVIRAKLVKVKRYLTLQAP
jgi:hypothetical protein